LNDDEDLSVDEVQDVRKGKHEQRVPCGAFGNYGRLILGSHQSSCVICM
jgi:hypothetical protein